MGKELSYQAALLRVLDAGVPGPRETVPFSAAAGRVLAERLLADRDDPPALKSAMDGFALRAADTEPASVERPLSFRWRGVVAAGHVPVEPLPPSADRRPGQRAAELPAVRIMTGALLPAGADAVVKQEDTERVGPDEFSLRQPALPGDHVIPPGARMRRGEALLEAGEALGPQALGILAAAHRAHVRVYRRPEVALLAIGDELVEPDQPLGPGKTPVTNLYVLAELARRQGARVRSLGIAPDDPGRILALLQPCLDPGAGARNPQDPPEAAGANGTPRCDLVLTLGGTHRGDFDFVHTVLERAGATLHFDRVRMTPAGSTIFATHGKCLLFGLPGTPVAAWVAFEALVRPALAKLTGCATLERPTLAARLEGTLEPTAGRAGFIPCRLEFGGPEPVARPIQGRHPHEAPASLRADGLIRCEETAPLPIRGDWVRVEWLADPGGQG
ncbi:MAG: molybdopterin molybdotransferase MoeA [SAR324 cluster bacterium]